MASSGQLYRYDVFISYSHADRPWVQTWLLPQLEAAGLCACIDDRDFAIGVPSIVNMEDAVTQSRHTLIVLTEAWVKDQWTAFGALLAQTTDPVGRHQHLLPLLLAPCQPPLRIAYLSYLDFTDPRQHTTQLRRLIDTLQGRTRPADLGQSLQHLLPDRLLTPDERSRRAMLRKVRTIWIDGLLKHSLYHETLITLGLHERPDAVARPLDVLLHFPNQADQPLPPDKHVIDVFDECDGALLILGAPGSGKTTLLLELARDLLDRAEHNPIYPMPVVFPLSSWAERRLPLVVWLVDELNKRYDVPRKLAQSWVAADMILPVLDGLDEVNANVRDACAEVINMYRQEHGFVPLVVSSRLADYDVLAIKLRLHGAIAVQPLTPKQVRSYLRQVGMTVTPSSTSPLWELLDSPLMLNIAILTYAEPSGSVIQIHDVHQDHLFAAYVARMFQRNSPHLSFSQQQTVQWLSWLAWQMQQHNQSVFYLEHMQPDSLPRHLRWLYRWSVPFILLLLGVLVGVLVTGFVPGLVFWMNDGRAIGLYVGLYGGLYGGAVGGMVAGLIGYARYAEHINPIESLSWSWSAVRAHVGLMVMGAVGGGIVGGVMGAVGDRLYGGLVFGLVSGLIIMLCYEVTYGVTTHALKPRTTPNQGIRRSGWMALIGGPIVGLVVGGGVGLAVELSAGMIAGLAAGLATALHFGGRSIVQHSILRLLLVRQGGMPVRYVRFLDFAAQRILLHKVGGGYIFIHRLLLDYFAKQYQGPETAEVSVVSEGQE